MRCSHSYTLNKKCLIMSSPTSDVRSSGADGDGIFWAPCLSLAQRVRVKPVTSRSRFVFLGKGVAMLLYAAVSGACERTADADASRDCSFYGADIRGCRGNEVHRHQVCKGSEHIPHLFFVFASVCFIMVSVDLFLVIGTLCFFRKFVFPQ